MLYDYKCGECGRTWEANLPMADRDKPLSEPCTQCGFIGEVKRVVSPASFIYDMKHPVDRAGSEWKDRLRQIQKNSGYGARGIDV